MYEGAELKTAARRCVAQQLNAQHLPGVILQQGGRNRLEEGQDVGFGRRQGQRPRGRRAVVVEQGQDDAAEPVAQGGARGSLVAGEPPLGGRRLGVAEAVEGQSDLLVAPEERAWAGVDGFATVGRCRGPAEGQ